MIDFDFEKNCYGCRNCENVCSTGAIKIIENKEGFLIPKIDKDKCINCGACEKKCPYIAFKENEKNIKKEKWYGCYAKDVESREKSTSGGIFPVLAKYFLDNDGLIGGCVWDENMKPVHILTDNLEDVNKMRGSKYLQSDVSNIVKQIKEQINEHQILFTGTPCQVAAVKLYIGNHPNLYTCSLICEGAPSNKVWQLYKNELEKKYKSKMVYASFRNKELAWDSPIAFYKFENNKEVKNLSFNHDKYVVGFLEGLYYRNSCSNCQYKGNGHNGDIIIGDLWGATKEQKDITAGKGISLVIVNSKRGQQLFDYVKEKLSYENIDKENAISHNKLLMQAIVKHKNRDTFFKNIDNIKFSKNVKMNIKRKMYKGNLKNILYRLGIFQKIKERK